MVWVVVMVCAVVRVIVRLFVRVSFDVMYFVRASIVFRVVVFGFFNSKKCC